MLTGSGRGGNTNRRALPQSSEKSVTSRVAGLLGNAVVRGHLSEDPMTGTQKADEKRLCGGHGTRERSEVEA